MTRIARCGAVADHGCRGGSGMLSWAAERDNEGGDVGVWERLSGIYV